MTTTAKKAVAKKAPVKTKTQVEHLLPDTSPTKRKTIPRAPKKEPFWDKVKALRAFYTVAAIIAGGGLPIICYNVAHVQLGKIDPSDWTWKAMFVAAVAGFIFSSATVFDLLSDWLSSKVKAAAWVIVSETVMLLGIEEWASLSVLLVLVVLNAGSVFVMLEKRRQKQEEALKEKLKVERRLQRENGKQIRSHGATNGRRKAS